MELLGEPSRLATFRPRYCRCFIVCSRCLSAPSPPSSFRVQIQFHPWSKQLFRIIPKAQSEDTDDVSGAHPLASLRRKVRRKEALERLDKQLLEGMKPPYVEYLMSLGFDLEDIRRIVGRYPLIQYHSMEQQIKPFVDVLRNVGMDHSSLLDILLRWPQAMGVSIEKKFMQTIAYFESLGMNKACCVKAICRFPQLITLLRREKIEAKVVYFLELGVSAENVRKMIVHSPQIFGMTVEKKLRPTTEFFLAKGFTIDELQTMVERYPKIYGCSVTKSLIPKYEFFLEMGYPSSLLVSFPQYFSYSLEGRIKPRYKLAKEQGVRFHPSRLLSTPNRNFGMLLEKSVSTRTMKDGG